MRKPYLRTCAGLGKHRGASRDKMSVALALDERGGARTEAIGLGRGARDGVNGFFVSCGVRRGCAPTLLAEEARTRAYPTTRRGYAAAPYPFHPELDESAGVPREG